MAEILLYGVIGDSFDKLDAATVTGAIRASSGPLAVRINSPGGFVMEGLAIVEALRAYPDKVSIYIDGLAASMASAVAMVGTEIIMAESALMMIHKPWDSSIGNADDLRRDAAVLDRIEQQLIGIYAKRTGLAAGRLADMLAAETWMTPEEAIDLGFITAISTPLKLAAMARASGYGFRHLPDRLKQQEGLMPEQNDSTAAVANERTRISTIIALCEKHGLPSATSQELIARGAPLDQVRATILDVLAGRSDSANIAGFGSSAFSGHQTLDNPVTYGDAIKGALVAKISGKAATGPATEFQGMSVVDMARDFLARQGARDVLRLSPDRIINAAMQAPTRGPSWGMGANLGGLHTTSDFPDLVGGAAETYLIDRYKLQESPLKRLARESTRSNFMVQYGVQIDGGTGRLDTVNEAGEFKNRTLNTRKEGYALKTYGNMFAVSRQMLINDALGALADVLQIMAGEAAETEAVVIAAMINNYVMIDGKPWFDADHNNLASTGAPPSIETLDAGRLAMRSQKTATGGLIDANPKFLLVPVTLQTAAETLVASTINPTTTDDVNPFAGKLESLADPRIANPSAWYLFADPELSPALEYAYLNGQRTPFTDSQDGWRVDGVEYKIRHDFGAGVMDYRMAWKNPG